MFIGRIHEISQLENAYASQQSEMVAVLGRRRVGKTYLIKHCFPKPDFECTGAHNGSMQQQLHAFYSKLIEYGYKPLRNEYVPSNWFEAFEKLKRLLSKKSIKRKQVVFIDELPWFDTPRSRFLDALGYFWNDIAYNKNILLVVCGSSASWMIHHIFHNKGGLHNRVTRRIELQPFTLLETEQYLRKKHIRFDRYAITLIYMTMGGIPFYLRELNKQESVAQNIDRICFSKNGLLYGEFQYLFSSLFQHAALHQLIIKALASKWKGLTRVELLRIIKYKDGGAISRTLEELERSAFITIIKPFGKQKKEQLYRICDPYTLFYLHFIAKLPSPKKGTFIQLAQRAVWHSWKGFAFENVCFYHIQKIEKALGISGIYTEHSSFYFKGKTNSAGVQIDMLISRSDNCIQLFEIKFSDTPYVLKKEQAIKIKDRVQLFQQYTRTRHTIFTTLITPFGVSDNIWSNSILSSTLTLDDIFI